MTDKEFSRALTLLGLGILGFALAFLPTMLTFYTATQTIGNVLTILFLLAIALDLVWVVYREEWEEVGLLVAILAGVVIASSFAHGKVVIY